MTRRLTGGTSALGHPRTAPAAARVLAVALAVAALGLGGCSKPAEPVAPAAPAAPVADTVTPPAAATAAVPPADTRNLKAQSGDAIDAAAQQKARTFWAAFRQAAIGRDAAALAALSAQPLEIRGETDSDPVQQLTGDDRSVALGQLLDREVFVGSGQPATALHRLIEQTPALPDGSWVAPTQLRVHNLSFDMTPGGEWRLSRVYVEAE